MRRASRLSSYFAIGSLVLLPSLSFAETIASASEGQEVAALDKFPAAKRGPLKTLTPEDIVAIQKALSTKPVDENTVSLYGLLQANLNLSDSQRKNVPDFAGQRARLGALVKGGIVTAQIEFEVLGNQPYAPNSNSGKFDPVTGQAKTTPSLQYNNAVVLRQAQLSLNLFTRKDDTSSYVTTASLGGVRVSGAIAIAPNLANTPTGFGRQDGFYVQQEISPNKTLNMKFGLGVFNAMNTTTPGMTNYATWGLIPNSQQNYWLNNSLNNNLAYVGVANITVNFNKDRSLNVLMYHGQQEHAPHTVSDAVPGALNTVRDIAHTEFSVLYNDNNLYGTGNIISGNGVSLWYERETNSRTQLASASSGDYTYSDGLVDDGDTASLFGFGVGGDTAPYLTNLLQKGDRLTYAISYTRVVNEPKNADVQSYTTSASTVESVRYLNYKVHQVALALGYAVNTFEVQLGGEYSKADKDLFTDSSGGSPKDSEIKTQISALYVF